MMPHHTSESSSGSGTPTTRLSNSDVTSVGFSAVPNGASSLQRSSCLQQPGGAILSSIICLWLSRGGMRLTLHEGASCVDGLTTMRC